jgi:hypothetical protein
MSLVRGKRAGQAARDAGLARFPERLLRRLTGIVEEL